MSALAATPDAYGGNGPLVLRVTWSLLAIATVLILIRTYIRLRLVSGGSLWSLFWAYCAWGPGVAAAVAITIGTHAGFGNHVQIVEEVGDPAKAGLYQWIWSACTSISLPIARFSVVAFLLDVQGRTHRSQRWIMFMLAGVGFVLNFVIVFIFFFQCDPPRKLWEPKTPGSCPLTQANYGVGTTSGGKQIDLGSFRASSAGWADHADLCIVLAWGAVTDLYLALWPVFLIYNLQIPVRLKVLLCTLMGLGVFTAVCSVVRTVKLKVVTGSKDPTYDAASLVIWGTVEDWIILIVSSVPAIWPCVQKILRLVNTSIGKKIISSKFLPSGGLDRPSAAVTSPDSSRSANGKRRFQYLGSSSSNTKSYDLEEDGIAMTQDIMVKHEDFDEGRDNDAHGVSNFDWRSLPAQAQAAKVSERI
ncbi:MAG: hypothetical protein M1828_006268 [Chrysothrix sp. TS-e1954]|nr:MAG: hypothetical protein M1828_006268 [Chrysothrix sp. TS-e1954]